MHKYQGSFTMFNFNTSEFRSSAAAAFFAVISVSMMVMITTQPLVA